jgi:hypothetical protein
MSSALVGSGYGWDGWVVCFGGGVFSSGGVVWRVWGVFLLGVRGVMEESVWGWGAGWVGGSGEKKNLLPCGSF